MSKSESLKLILRLKALAHPESFTTFEYLYQKLFLVPKNQAKPRTKPISFERAKIS